MFEKDYSCRVWRRKGKAGSERTVWRQLWKRGPKGPSVLLERKRWVRRDRQLGLVITTTKGMCNGSENCGGEK